MMSTFVKTERTPERHSKRLCQVVSIWVAAWCGLSWLTPSVAKAEGIPEPPLVLYGTVRNLAEGNQRLTSGTLTWQFRKVSSGRTVTLAVPLENVLDQFSYVLLVPMEMILSGVQVSTNALDVTPTGAQFDRSMVLLETNAATFAVPAQSSFVVASTNRARIERVDLTVNIPVVDQDQNSLADQWELQYFGFIGVDPDGDADGDRMTNWQEYKAGTDPTDENSNLRFTRIAQHGQGGVLLEWTSAADVYYALQRAGHIKGPYVDFAVGIPASESGNVTTYRDTNAPAGGAYYRLHLDQVPIASLDSDGSGFPDDWERLYFGHLGITPNQDADGDGLSNSAEFRAGTNPSDRNSALRFVHTEVVHGTVVLGWSSVYEKRYRLLQADSPNGPYTTLQSNILASPPWNQFTNQVAGASRRFYRVQLEN